MFTSLHQNKKKISRVTTYKSRRTRGTFVSDFNATKRQQITTYILNIYMITKALWIQENLVHPQQT